MGGANNGTVTSSVSGGTSPYTYMWSNGAITSNINLLPPGCYSVTVTDALGCQSTSTSCVASSSGPILYSNSNVVSSFQVVNGGFTPQWVCANQTLQTDGGIMKIYLESGATMLTGGGIDTVYAKTGSTITMNGGIHVIYHEPGVTLNMNGGIPTLYPCPSLVFNYAQAPVGGCPTVVTCNLSISLTAGNSIGGGNNGGISTNTSNGTFPFTYAWSNGQSTSSISGLSPGTYSVLVTDANGCTATGSANIINSAGPTVLSNSNVVSSYQVVNGGFTPQWVCTNDTLYTDGGIMNIYLESGATMITGGGIDSIFAKSGSTIIMNGGIHRIYHEPGVNLIMNGGIPYLYPCPSLIFNYSQAPANGCSAVPNCNLTSSTTSSSVLCNGASTGSINLSLTGGTAPFTYLWSNNATVQDPQNLAAGTYSVTVTDANGCTSTSNATLTQPTALDISISSTQVLCFGGNNGSINLTPSGGAAPYTYLWSNNSTVQDPQNLSAGLYSVVVTDANGCTISTGATITQPAALNVTISATDEMMGLDGTASASVTGGTAPFTYAWSNGGTNSVESGLSAGMYSLTVTDANGCSEVTEVVVGSQVGLTSLETSSSVLIYPNPVAGELFIKFNSELKAEKIMVYAIDGRFMTELSMLEGELKSLDIQNWSNGSYYLRVLSSEGSTCIPFVKQ